MINHNGNFFEGVVIVNATDQQGNASVNASPCLYPILDVVANPVRVSVEEPFCLCQDQKYHDHDQSLVWPLRLLNLDHELHQGQVHQTHRASVRLPVLNHQEDHSKLRHPPNLRRLSALRFPGYASHSRLKT